MKNFKLPILDFVGGSFIAKGLGAKDILYQLSRGNLNIPALGSRLLDDMTNVDKLLEGAIPVGAVYFIKRLFPRVKLGELPFVDFYSSR